MDNLNICIDVHGLSYKFGHHKILNNICFSLTKGKVYSIIGPNGSGKTTLLNCLSGIFKVHKDTVFVNSKDISTLKTSEIAKELSYVHQNTALDLDFTVEDIVMMGRNPYIKRLHSESRNDIKIVEEAMKFMNVLEYKDKRSTQLSGGEKQRTIIARAIAQECDIMLLDEPTSQLDIYHQAEVLKYIKDISSKKNITAIVVLHDINLAAQYSDFMMLLHEGNIIAFDPPQLALTPLNILKVYNFNVDVTQNPFTQRPYILPTQI